MFWHRKKKLAQADGVEQSALALWQRRAAEAAQACAEQRARMREREELYQGSRVVDRVGPSGQLLRAEGGAPATVVRNIVAESVESLVESGIPQPKVSPRCARDEGLAALIEDLLRAELDRQPFEQLNDMDERTTPIQGGDFFLVEWDSEAAGPLSDGELSVSLLHPRQVLPQPGVLQLEQLDYVITEVAQTRQHIKRRYGLEVEQGEQEPQARGAERGAPEVVTLYTAYYRNERGGIGLFRWAGDTVLEQHEDYQCRQLNRCGGCGAAVSPDTRSCPDCGGGVVRTAQEHLELTEDIVTGDGRVIPARSPLRDEQGLPVWDAQGRPVTEATKIPHYRPGCLPLVLRKNVSLFGSLLGDSDVDKIRDQQNAIKKTGTRIEEKIGKGGSIVTLPKQLAIRATDEELKVVELDNPAQRAMIDVLTIQPDIGKDLAYLDYNYRASRQILGLTDSFQGRADATAQSGLAKQFAAAQTAGRLESRRVMKQAAYARLFELMFKFLLAYADEPRSVARRTPEGRVEYVTFNRYDFLQQDESGEWFWNDRFLFSVDETSSLASNRAAMWSETLASLRSGAFGDPAALSTLILYWGKLELLHYPGAKDTRQQLERRLAEQAEQAEQRVAEGGEGDAVSQLWH